METDTMIHGPGNSGGDLEEVEVKAKKVDTALDPVKVNVQRVEDPLPEITVSGVRIPWWVWGLVGALAVMVLVEGKRR